MRHHLGTIGTLLTMCGLMLAGAATADAQVGNGDSFIPHSGYSDRYGVPPQYIHPRYRRSHYGYRCSPYRRPHQSYGKYLFHVKYKYPELDYGLRHSPSSHYFRGQRPFIILPAPPQDVSPSLPVPNMNESSRDAPPIPSPELSDRFYNLARAANGVVVVPVAAKTSPRIDMTKRPMTGDGWELLRKGEATGAWRSFTVDAANDPHNSLPRIGYAIAAAMWDDQEKAVWSMRRAVRLDPAAIVSVDADEALAAQLTKLRRTAINKVQSESATADDHFMLAAIQVMLGDVEDADRALNDAIDSGDESESVTNLQAVIDTLLRQDSFGDIVAAVSLAN